jgi:hypothetical protein
MSLTSHLTALISLMLALAPALQAAPLAAAPPGFAATRTITLITVAPPIATPIPALSPTSGDANYCIPELVFDPTLPPPCGPFKTEENYDEFMRCMNDPAQCEGTDAEKGLIADACELHPEMPACGGRVGDGDVPKVKSDNPFGNMIEQLRCMVDPELPECKDKKHVVEEVVEEVARVSAEVEDEVAEMPTEEEDVAKVPAVEEEGQKVKRWFEPFIRCPSGPVMRLGKLQFCFPPNS